MNQLSKFFQLLFLVFPLTLNAQSLFNEKELIANLKFLSSDSLKGRQTGTPENAIARNFVIEKFKQLKLTPFASGYELPFEFENRSGTKIKGVNVAGWIKGKKDSYIVISAHYDQLIDAARQMA